MAVVPGLASLPQPSPTRPVSPPARRRVLGCHPVAPSDIGCSLDRDMNVKLGGCYVVIFDRV